MKLEDINYATDSLRILAGTALECREEIAVVTAKRDVLGADVADAAIAEASKLLAETSVKYFDLLPKLKDVEALFKT